MRRVREKLKSNSGATILFAILVFMLCILAGTGALTAAAANSGRYTHLKADQQQYLSVSSAAKLLKKELSGTTFTAKARVTETVTTGPGGTTTTRKVDWADTANHITYDGGLKALLASQLEDLFEYGVCSGLTGSPTTTTGFDITGTKPTVLDKSYTIDADKAGKVTAKLTMGTTTADLTSNDFIITIELNEGQKYASTLTLVATFASGAGENGLNSTQISQTTDPATNVTTTVTEYTMEVQWLEDNARVTVPEPTETTGG